MHDGIVPSLDAILRAAPRRPLDVAREGVESFDTSEHESYSEEEPNALTAEEARMREEFPQHYGMTFLGFATGLRPSSLRPLRRKGPTPWDEGVLLCAALTRSGTK